MREQWREAQKWEAWAWADCINVDGEVYKQNIYANLMLFPMPVDGFFDFGKLSIVV